MGPLTTISRNIASNAVGYVVAIGAALLMTPFVIHTLGDDSYAIWSLVVSLTGYYGILDLGIRSAVGQYVTRYWTNQDIGGVNRTMSTAVAMTLPIAVLLLLLSALIAWLAPALFTLAPSEVPEARLAIVVMGTAVALSFPFGVLGSATYARQRFDIANLVGIGERLLNLALAYWVLAEGHGLIGIAIVTASTQTIAWLLRCWIAFRLLPGLSLSPRWCNRDSMRELTSFSVYNFLINIADQIVLSTDLLVIGIMMPDIDAVTYYSVGGACITYFMMIINAVAWTLTPYATACDASGDRPALRRLWVSGSKNIFLLAGLIGGGLIFLGHDFLSVWIDPGKVSGEKYTSSATIMAVLAGATLLRAMMTCGKQVLFGMRKVRFLARLSMLEAVSNLVLSLILIKPFGLLGVALGTLIPIAGTQLILQPRFLAHTLELSLRQFVVRAAPGGLMVLATMGAVSWGVTDLLPVSGWPSLILKATVVTAPALLVGVLLGTTREEKQRVRRKLGLVASTSE
ncbi:MAG: polysaccharide biosynthesis protein [Planctomycetes bacterium]|nr:polysaccharide biosynthesis protein [Planctomycetota bacterium]MCB9885274.1 polysaccharide biosynthesis protein [Planctomycetota bacterium]